MVEDQSHWVVASEVRIKVLVAAVTSMSLAEWRVVPVVFVVQLYSVAFVVDLGTVVG